MNKKFKSKTYDGERYSKTEWIYNCLNKFGYDFGLQYRKQIEGGEIISSLKFYQRKKVESEDKKERVCLEELNPHDYFFMYGGKKGKITKEEFIQKANDGDTIPPHWIVLDIDFNHKPIDFGNEQNLLFKVLRKFDDEKLNYVLWGTEEGRGIKVVFMFKELLQKNDEKLKRKIGEYIISLISEYKPELKLSGQQCSLLYPAKDGEDPIHPKTNQPIKILHFTGMDNSLKVIEEKLPEEAVYRYECISCGNEIVLDRKKQKREKCSCGGKLKQVKEEPRFNYGIDKPAMNIISLHQLEEVIRKNFPSIWFETKACLSASATLRLKNLNGCPSLNLVGNPSDEKTTILSFFYGQNKTYLSDDFTPRAFVSHSANVGAEDLENIDLLPRIRNSILITPELAPLFEAPKEKLIDNFSILTRVLDGEGLNRDSGTHGHRGYSGDYKFVWLGATTPLRSSVWNVMGKIGNRLFFLKIKDKNRNDEDYLEMFRGKAYDEKVKECRGAVRNFLDNIFSKGIRNLDWDAEGDIFLLPEIIKYAKFLAKLRTSLMIWKSEEQGKYEFNFPIQEEPPRAINALYNLAKGHAIINGRTFLRSEDLEIVRAVCFSSMPHDRSEFLKLLGKHEGKLTTSQIQSELNCSDETARKTMEVFKVLGLVDLKSIQIDSSGTGRPMNYIEIKKEFEELLKHTQVLKNLENPKPNENDGASDDFDSLKPEDFVKNPSKTILTRPSNNLEKPFPIKNNPVSDEKIDFSDLDLRGSQNE